MTGLAAIQAAIQQLNPAGRRAEFRAWFERFDAAEWDQAMEQDIAAGALDWLADEALADLQAGRCTDR
jgi:hypothetical protein